MKMPLFIYENMIEQNVRSIMTKTNKPIMAVVKSDAYGLNVFKIIPILIKAGVNFFVFNTYQEFLKCEKLFTKEEILILDTYHQENLLTSYPNLAFSVNSFLDAINITKSKFSIKVHLRIDTGMNRLGIRSKAEFDQTMKLLKKTNHIMIEGLYTHFSTGAIESKYFEKQMANFKKYEKSYHFKYLHANATRSLNKTIIGNYVRVGLGLYGFGQPFLNLKKALSLKVKPINIFLTNHQTKIGYNDLYLSKNKYIGILPFGYNDIDLTELKTLFYKGQKYPYLGKSCMNHTHFLADDKINYLTWLSIFPTNGIISISDEYNINWYRILTSLKKWPKSYIRRNYDLPKILKYHGEKSCQIRLRKRSR